MKNDLKIKVCGMRDPVNIDELVSVKPDYIGFIFYPPSKRYIRDITNGQAVGFIPREIKRTGVFVNAGKEEIIKTAGEYNLKAIQLHGYESPRLCIELQQFGLEILKAFLIDENFIFASLQEYADACNYFLFDTKTEGHGGSGQKFNWTLLEKYNLDRPFFLSGGICPDDVGEIDKINHPLFYGIDINSRFETAPGIKDIRKVANFVQQIRNSNH